MNILRHTCPYCQHPITIQNLDLDELQAAYEKLKIENMRLNLQLKRTQTTDTYPRFGVVVNGD